MKKLDIYFEEKQNRSEIKIACFLQMRLIFLQSSLVAHMEKLGLLRDGLCYIEFGAGKGGLSHWVQKATPLCHKNKYLLVEKGCIR